MSIELIPLEPRHHARFAAWLSDPEIQQWLAGRWHGRSFDERHIAVMAAAPANCHYAVEREDQHVGMVCLAELDRVERSAELWYVIDAAARGRGLGRAAVSALAARAFDELELISLRAWVTRGNHASVRVLEAAGFARVGVLRRASLHHGSHVDRDLFDRVAPDIDA